jgi:hypothetical protein
MGWCPRPGPGPGDRKILGPDGLPQTLEALAAAGALEAKHYTALEQFFDACADLHLVFGEVNVAGLMYTESRSGGPEFVLVDGIGEKLLIPVRSWFKSVNTSYVRKVQRRLMGQVQALVQAAAQA